MGSRDQAIWTLVVFFGATVLFQVIVEQTKGQPVPVTIAIEAAAALVLVGVIVAIVRRRG
jgi:membrane protein DedA with SNARE-associated domain